MRRHYFRINRVVDTPLECYSCNQRVTMVPLCVECTQPAWDVYLSMGCHRTKGSGGNGSSCGVSPHSAGSPWYCHSQNHYCDRSHQLLYWSHQFLYVLVTPVSLLIIPASLLISLLVALLSLLVMPVYLLITPVSLLILYWLH